MENKKKKKLKKLKNLFHIDADCLCAVVTMSSEHKTYLENRRALWILF